MSTTPQKMLTWVMLPQLSLRQLLGMIVACAGLMWTYRRAIEGTPWAVSVLYATGFVVAFFVMMFLFALIAWLPSRILAGNYFAKAGNPFADGQLPPAMTAAPKEQKL